MKRAWGAASANNRVRHNDVTDLINRTGGRRG
jgi:hypothetical protein